MPIGRQALARAAERVQPGEHLCVVYQQPDERLATLGPFLRAAFEQRERCVVLVDESDAHGLLGALRRDGLDIDGALAGNALVIADHRDTYLKDGRFDPDTMFRYFDDEILASRHHGFESTRVLGEMAWALGAPPRVERMVEYEARLNEFLVDRHAAALCYYDWRRFPGPIIRSIFETHPQVVSDGLVCDNPFYVSPEVFLKEDEQEKVARWLRALVDRERLEEEILQRQEQLVELSRRLVRAQEDERREVAREIHDELGQLLTAVKLMVAEGARAATPAAARRLREAESLIVDMMEKLRNLSLRLRPAMLDDMGLAPTLDWFVPNFQSRTRVNVVLEAEGLEGRRFAPEVETTVYRIVQEALTNVARHARTSVARVRVWADDEALHVHVEDRGTGFDPDAVSGVGLVGMRERAIALGGALRVETSPGTGVVIEALLPLAAPSAR